MNNSKKLTLLEKQLSDVERKTVELRETIAAEKSKNNPKNIMDLVTSYESACKYKGVKPTLSYTDRNGRSIHSIAHDRLEFIISVLNEGYEFKMTPTENRYYVWFQLSTSAPSGLVFDDTAYGDRASADSAAHLSFKNAELAKHSAICPEILNDWAKFIIGK